MTGKAKEKAKLNREWQQISAVSLLLNFDDVHYSQSDIDLLSPY